MKRYAFQLYLLSVMLLAVSGCVPSKPESPTPQMMFDAVQRGDAEEVRRLLQLDPDLADAAGERDRRPLHLAAAAGHEDIVEILLGAGADVNAVDISGWTPLHDAARSGHVAVARHLTAAGARLEEIDNAGRTPLHVAAQNGHEGVVELLLDQGADIEAREGEFGGTPLHLAAMEGRSGTVELLIEREAAVNAVDEQGRTPLALAVENDHQATADILRAHGGRLQALERRPHGCNGIQTSLSACWVPCLDHLAWESA